MEILLYCANRVQIIYNKHNGGQISNETANALIDEHIFLQDVVQKILEKRLAEVQNKKYL